MTTVDFASVEKTHGSLSSWMSSHGAAMAVLGCLVFWTAVGVSLYFAL